jgi:hypothetical protein
MKIIALSFLFFSLFVIGSSDALAQGKGIDTQNREIQNIGNGQGPTDNASNRTTGTGRGFDFGAGKTPDRGILANPYRMASRRDILLTQIADVMRERNLVLDEAASRPADGVLVTQPYVFAKGAVVTGSQLLRYAALPDRDEAWSRGRYTLTIEVQTIDGANNNVSVTAKVEGRSESGQGSSWLTLTSSGEAENEFLATLVERITGTSPYQTTAPAETSTDKPQRDQ